MKPEGSLRHSQVPAICPYSEPERCSPYRTSYFLKVIVREPNLSRLFNIQSTESHALLPLLRSYPRIRIGLRLFLWMVRNMIRFYGSELQVSRPTPKLEDHPLSAIRDLMQYIRGYPPFWRPFHHPQPEYAPCRGDTHLSRVIVCMYVLWRKVVENAGSGLLTLRWLMSYIYDISHLRVNDLSLILLTWRKWWANNASN
jgi:hypothetical protein